MAVSKSSINDEQHGISLDQRRDEEKEEGSAFRDVECLGRNSMTDQAADKQWSHRRCRANTYSGSTLREGFLRISHVIENRGFGGPLHDRVQVGRPEFIRSQAAGKTTYPLVSTRSRTIADCRGIRLKDYSELDQSLGPNCDNGRRAVGLTAEIRLGVRA
jgi:hypothetical protein